MHKTKNRLMLFLLVLAGHTAFAQLKPDDKRSSVQFTIENLGFDVKGTFSGIQGTINFYAQSPSHGSFDINIDATTVNTGNTLRDGHLKQASFFDVQKYPRIRFVSSSITPSKHGTYVVTGQLTIKGKTEEISFPFTVSTPGSDLVFKGSFKINRKDFDVGGTSTVANELEVFLSIQATKA